MVEDAGLLVGYQSSLTQICAIVVQNDERWKMPYLDNRGMSLSRQNRIVARLHQALCDGCSGSNDRPRMVDLTIDNGSNARFAPVKA